MQVLAVREGFYSNQLIFHLSLYGYKFSEENVFLNVCYYLRAVNISDYLTTVVLGGWSGQVVYVVGNTVRPVTA